jgi:hypothetical protein
MSGPRDATRYFQRVFAGFRFLALSGTGFAAFFRENRKSLREGGIQRLGQPDMLHLFTDQYQLFKEVIPNV